MLKWHDVKDGANAEIGQSDLPIWNFSPTDCIIPVLHCELGTVKVQIFDHLFPFLLDIDTRTEEEDKVRIRLKEFDRLISDQEQLLPIQKEERDNSLNGIKEQKKILTKERSRKKGMLDRAKSSIRQNSSQRVQTLMHEVEALNIEFISLNKQKDDINMHWDASVNALSTAKSHRSEVLKEIKMLVKKRSKSERSIDTKLEEIFARYNVYLQVYHGGSLTGGDILNLLRNHDAIISELIDVCITVLNDRRLIRPHQIPIPTDDEAIAYLQDHNELLFYQDAVYGNLRIVHPNKKEMKETRMSIRLMERKWNFMSFSLTPKAHTVFAHSADDQQRFGGLGDKIEDALERMHQKQANQDHRTLRMKGGNGCKLNVQGLYAWQQTNPLIVDQIQTVQQMTSRKFSDHASNQNRNTPNKEIIRRRERLSRLRRMYVEIFGNEAE